jgi:hypothetical protein
VRALANQDSRSDPGDAVEPRPLGCKAHVVFLGFEELIANLSDKEPTDSGALRSWQRRLACEKEIYNRRSERDAKDTNTSKTPVSAINDEFRRNWREVEGVSTSLNVTPQQQEDLLIAGQMVVCLHEPEIAAELSNADYRP